MPRNSFVLPSVLEAIGETPMVELSRLTHGLDDQILAKLESSTQASPRKIATHSR